VSVIHLRPPRRHSPPSWLRHPLQLFHRGSLPWPRAWAAILLILNGGLHLGRASWVIVTSGMPTYPAALVGLFGLAYLLLGVWLLQKGQRVLVYATLVPALGLLLGSISFVTSFDRDAGVNWLALVMLLINVLVVPLCLAGSGNTGPWLPRRFGSGTRSS
jgi:hypothetical protein